MYIDNNIIFKIQDNLLINLVFNLLILFDNQINILYNMLVSLFKGREYLPEVLMSDI